jgi:hypothetical protein
MALQDSQHSTPLDIPDSERRVAGACHSRGTVVQHFYAPDCGGVSAEDVDAVSASNTKLMLEENE